MNDKKRRSRKENHLKWQKCNSLFLSSKIVKQSEDFFKFKGKNE